ncbi:S26 family signal peptidase [bacterium]|nr:S26 family signal peptidase [bacterium]
MEPTLIAGQGLIGLRQNRVRPGELRCVEHPGEPGLWLVKRVESVDRSAMRIASDNTDVAAVDSRLFGPVPILGSYRVIACVPLRWM